MCPGSLLHNLKTYTTLNITSERPNTALITIPLTSQLLRGVQTPSDTFQVPLSLIDLGTNKLLPGLTSPSRPAATPQE